MQTGPPTTPDDPCGVHAWPHESTTALSARPDLPLASARSHVIGWSWVLLGLTQGYSWFLLSPGATGADITEWHMVQG